MNPNKDVFFWLLGMLSGFVAYIKGLPDFFKGIEHTLMFITWDDLAQRVATIAWAGGIAFFTGAMAVVGKRIGDKAWQWVLAKWTNRKPIKR